MLLYLTILSLQVLPGNHEIEQEGPSPATQEKFLAYQKRFRMPSKESGSSSGNLYYSFEVLPEHTIRINDYFVANASLLLNCVFGVLTQIIATENCLNFEICVLIEFFFSNFLLSRLDLYTLLC